MHKHKRKSKLNGKRCARRGWVKSLTNEMELKHHTEIKIVESPNDLKLRFKCIPVY